MFRRLADFWYGTAPPERLGMLRVAIGGYALWYVGTRIDTIAKIARNDSTLYEPVGPFRFLGGPWDPAIIDGLVWFTMVFGAMFVLGVAHRLVGPVFSLLLLLTLSYRNSWSMVYHSHNAVVLHVLILGFVRSADAFSIGAALRARAGAPAPGACATYLWPVRLICAVTAVQYLLAGLAKLASPAGIMWAGGASLREQIAADTIRKEVLEGGGMPLAFWLYDHVWLFTLIGISTLILELGAPLFLLDRRTRRAWAVGVWLMQWGIFLIMGIRFRYQLSFIMFLPFFRVERIATLLRRLALPGTGPSTVATDGAKPT